MRAAFVILAHERFDRVAEVASHLAAEGAAVVVHVDRQGGAASLQAAHRKIGGAVRIISTQRTVWGQLGLVDAALDGVRMLLDLKAQFSHVCLLSGSCLPIRPLADLDRLLAENGTTDFIESSPLAESDWVQGGLSGERFTLWHPFAWRSQRRLFDLNVEVQRRLGIRRLMPDGLEPHLGLQWWCLSRATLERIITLPELDTYRRFFRRVWIPDESFFQTLVRAHAGGRIESRALTLQRFDAFGRPHVFHDDHGDFLAGADAYFARKIDPDADGLYQRYLTPNPKEMPRHPVDSEPFDAARRDTKDEGRGIAGAGRMQRGTTAFKIAPAAPYLAIVGDDTYRLSMLGIGANSPGSGLRFHGFLFAEGGAEFADPGATYVGNLPGIPVLRDYRPAQFLGRVLWADRGLRSVFLFRPDHDQQVAAQLCRDPMARIVILSERPAGEILQTLRRPAVVKRRRKLRLRPRRNPGPTELNAWIQVLDTDPNDPGVERAAIQTLLTSDWTDPQYWTVPAGEDTR